MLGMRIAINKPMRRKSNRRGRLQRAGDGGIPVTGRPANGPLRERGKAVSRQLTRQVSGPQACVKGRACTVPDVRCMFERAVKVKVVPQAFWDSGLSFLERTGLFAYNGIKSHLRQNAVGKENGNVQIIFNGK